MHSFHFFQNKLSSKHLKERNEYLTKCRASNQDNQEILINLLTCYTRGNLFWRIIGGHWNRNHIKEVNRIIDGIRLSHDSAEQVLEKLLAIKLTNQTGSLANCINFLDKQIQTNFKDIKGLDPRPPAKPCIVL